MSKEYRLPKIDNDKDLIRGIINASYWHWNNIDKAQHTRAIEFLNTLVDIDNSNPSEALECLKNIEGWTTMFRSHKYNLLDYDLGTIKQALLKAQEDEKLKVDICEMFGLDNLFPYNDTKAILKELEEYMGIKNQLWVDFMKTSKKLKEQEKVLEIIKEKKVNVNLLIALIEYSKKMPETKPLEIYNNSYIDGMELTQDEFDLLKRWLEDEKEN